MPRCKRIATITNLSILIQVFRLPKNSPNSSSNMARYRTCTVVSHEFRIPQPLNPPKSRSYTLHGLPNTNTTSPNFLPTHTFLHVLSYQQSGSSSYRLALSFKRCTEQNQVQTALFAIAC